VESRFKKQRRLGSRIEGELFGKRKEGGRGGTKEDNKGVNKTKVHYKHV
jgi:hypothetical protein